MSQYPPPQYPQQYPPQYPQQNPLPYYGPPPQGKPGSITAIGIIGIILSLLCGGGSAIGMMPYLAPTGTPNPVVDGVRQQGLLTLFLTVAAITILLQVVLLAGSVGTLALKRWGRTVMMLYAGGMLLAVVADIALSAMYVLPLLDQAMPSDGSARAQGFAVGMKGGLLFGAALRLVFPVCVLAVMTRPNVKAAFDRQP